MNVCDVPFSKHLEIQEHNETALSLPAKQTLHNHIGTVHASAQFALAETQSALYLSQQFPELSSKVVPLLRGATVKYKQTSSKDIVASSMVTDEAQEKFLTQYEKKGRASITVLVALRDVDDILTMTGEFTWFIQQLEV